MVIAIVTIGQVLPNASHFVALATAAWVGLQIFPKRKTPPPQPKPFKRFLK